MLLASSCLDADPAGSANDGAGPSDPGVAPTAVDEPGEAGSELDGSRPVSSLSLVIGGQPVATGHGVVDVVDVQPGADEDCEPGRIVVFGSNSSVFGYYGATFPALDAGSAAAPTRQGFLAWRVELDGSWVDMVPAGIEVASASGSELALALGTVRWCPVALQAPRSTGTEAGCTDVAEVEVHVSAPAPLEFPDGRTTCASGFAVTYSDLCGAGDTAPCSP